MRLAVSRLVLERCCHQGPLLGPHARMKNEVLMVGPQCTKVALSLPGGTATCNMATGVVTTQQGLLALLTPVTMRTTSKSENTPEEFLNL